jgi:hypothetical protein
MRRIPPTLMLTAAMTAAAAGLLVGPVRSLPQPDRAFALPWPVLAALFGASVILRIHLQFRREVHSVTLMELPLVLGLHFVDPLGLVLARLAGSVPALVIHSRQRGSKLLFNTGLFSLEAGVAALVFSWLLAGQAPAGTAGLAATFGAVLATDLLSAGLVIAAISLQEGALERAAAWQAMAGGAAAAVVNTSLALIAVAILATDRQVAWLLLVLAGVLFVAYRAYASLRDQYERSSRLHQFSRVVARSERLGAVTATILAETQVLLRAELIMFPATACPFAPSWTRKANPSPARPSSTGRSSRSSKVPSPATRRSCWCPRSTIRPAGGIGGMGHPRRHGGATTGRRRPRNAACRQPPRRRRRLPAGGPHAAPDAGRPGGRRAGSRPADRRPASSRRRAGASGPS